jgi:hypothetical protein
VGDYPRSCDDVKKDLSDRHEPFAETILKPIGNDAVLHRLVISNDIDPQTQKPSKSAFSNHGLSVYIQSENYPLDIAELAELIEESDKFIGSVKLNPEELQDMGFEICPDPYPDPSGNKQHPNHAQVVCKKTPGKTKIIRDNCQWSVIPKEFI